MTGGMARGPVGGPVGAHEPDVVGLQPFQGVLAHRRRPAIWGCGNRPPPGSRPGAGGPPPSAGAGLGLGGEPGRVLQDHHPQASRVVQRPQGVLEAPPAFLDRVAARWAEYSRRRWRVSGRTSSWRSSHSESGSVGASVSSDQARTSKQKPGRRPGHPLPGQVRRRRETVGRGDLGQRQPGAVVRQPLGWRSWSCGDRSRRGAPGPGRPTTTSRSGTGCRRSRPACGAGIAATRRRRPEPRVSSVSVIPATGTNRVCLGGVRVAMRLALDLKLPAETGCSAATRKVLAVYLREFGTPPDIVDDVILAMDEACSNVFKHAYPDGTDGQLPPAGRPSEGRDPDRGGRRRRRFRRHGKPGRSGEDGPLAVERAGPRGHAAAHDDRRGGVADPDRGDPPPAGQAASASRGLGQTPSAPSVGPIDG